MSRFIKSVIVAVVACLPLLLAYVLPLGSALYVLPIYGLLVFWLNFGLIFKPEQKLPTIRNAELDAVFDSLFADVDTDGERFPFRVHVFQRCGCWPIEWLQMVYTYKCGAADADRGICFWRYFGRSGQGLVW
jgi:hypothetical protein